MISTRKFYVIRRKSDGTLMPAMSKGRHGTHAKFGDPVAPPRLFRRAADAKVCLTHWVRGETIVVRTGGGQWEDYDERWQTTPRPERGTADDYEVLSCTLVLRRSKEKT